MGNFDPASASGAGAHRYSPYPPGPPPPQSSSAAASSSSTHQQPAGPPPAPAGPPPNGNGYMAADATVNRRPSLSNGQALEDQAGNDPNRHKLANNRLKTLIQSRQNQKEGTPQNGNPSATVPGPPYLPVSQSPSAPTGPQSFPGKKSIPL